MVCPCAISLVYRVWLLVILGLCGGALALTHSPECVWAQEIGHRSSVIELGSLADIRLEASVEYCVDSNKTLTLPVILAQYSQNNGFLRSQSRGLSFGINRYAYWLTFGVRRKSNAKHDWLLEIGHPILDTVAVYWQNADGTWQRQDFGDAVPVSTRPVFDRNFVLPLALSDTSVHRYFIRIASGSSLQIPLTIYSAEAFRQASVYASLGFGLYFGGMLILALYNVFLGFALRSRSYFYYAMFVLSVVTFFSHFGGYFSQYIVGGYPLLSNAVVPCSIACSCIALMLFSRRFLEIRLYSRFFDVCHGVMLWCCTLFLVVFFFLPPQASTLISISLTALAPLVTFLASIFCWRKGNHSAPYLLAAMLLFLLGNYLNNVISLGITYRHSLTGHLAEIGSLCEAVLLSFALADRYRILRQEQERAQNEALRLQKVATEELEEKVRMRTKELQESNEEVLRQMSILDNQAHQIELSNVALQEKNVLLQHLDHEKSELLGIVAHDLKNPLTSMRMTASMMRSYSQRFDAEKIRETGEKMELTINRMNTIIKGLLDSHRWETGAVQVHLSAFLIVPLVQELVQEYVQQASHKGIRIETHIHDTAQEAQVFADNDKTVEVIENLLSNAVKYSPHGKNVFVRVKSSVDAVRVEVQDEGPGISEEDMKKLFGKFARLSARPTGGEHSTGLGLSIVKKMVEAMHGRVWCESELGKGATFVVELPQA